MHASGSTLARDQARAVLPWIDGCVVDVETIERKDGTACLVGITLIPRQRAPGVVMVRAFEPQRVCFDTSRSAEFFRRDFRGELPFAVGQAVRYRVLRPVHGAVQQQLGMAFDIEHDERTREQEQFHDGLIPEWWCDLQAAERRAEAARGEDEEKRRAEALGLAVASDPAEEARLAELNSRFADFTFESL